MQMPARKAECCLGNVAMPSESEKTTKPPARNICRKKSSMVAASGYGLDVAAGAKVMTRLSVAIGCCVVLAAAVSDVAEEEVACLPSGGREPEKMTEGGLAKMEDVGEIERGGVEAEG
jgi:hypothetical protein